MEEAVLRVKTLEPGARLTGINRSFYSRQFTLGMSRSSRQFAEDARARNPHADAGAQVGQDKVQDHA